MPRHFISLYDFGHEPAQPHVGQFLDAATITWPHTCIPECDDYNYAETCCPRCAGRPADYMCSGSTCMCTLH